MDFDRYEEENHLSRLVHRLNFSHVEVTGMDIEDQLKRLQALFTHALSSTVTAKARYLSLQGEPSSTPAAIARAKAFWQQLESQKTAIIARMVSLEELEEEAVS
jgi:hypothetical protein